MGIQQNADCIYEHDHACQNQQLRGDRLELPRCLVAAGKTCQHQTPCRPS